MVRAEEVAGRRKAHTFRAVEEKRRIVEETLRDGASVSSVARAHGVNANQVFQWRRLYRDGLLAAAPGGDEMRLLPVVVSDHTRAEIAGLSATESLDEPVSAGSSVGVIELTFAWGKLRIAGTADAVTLRTVLGCLLT
jgi:transposase